MCKAADKYSVIVKLDKLEKELNNFKSVLIEKDSVTYKKVLKQLRDLLVNSWSDSCKTAVDNAIEYVRTIGVDDFNETALKQVDAIMQQSLGLDLAGTVETAVMNINQKALKLGLKEVQTSIKMKLGFDVKDEEAAAILGKHNLFYIGDYYNDQLKTDIDKIIREYLVGDKTIDDIIKDFQFKFSKITDKGQTYFEGLAQNTINRTREIGHINGFEKAEIEEYEVVAVLDDKTSAICEAMNGKVFTVQRAIEIRDAILSLDNPRDIKDVAPWRTPDEIKGLSAADLPAGMEFPPYHFGGCRTTIVARIA